MTKSGRWKNRIALCALLLLLGAGTAQAGEVERWRHAIEEAVELIPEPWASSRHAAMAYIAISDSLNAIDRRFEPFALDASERRASPTAATAAAAYTVLTRALQEYAPIANIVPIATIQAIYDETYAAALATVREGTAKQAGIALGQSAANAILATRAGDSVIGALVFPYTPGTEPGDYQLISVPGSPFGVVFAGYHLLIAPFILDGAAEFRASEPPAISSLRYALDALEVKAFGRDVGSSRSAEQSEIAHFWFENSLTGWARIGSDLAARRRLDERQQARLFALLALVIADGSLAHFDTKYFYDRWRPVTALTAADTGNPLVASDPTWRAFCLTPPTPEYASGHSLNGAGSAAVLESVFGDSVGFSATSLTLPGVTRTFRNFSEASRENAESRVLCGIHFRHSIERGQMLGRQIGNAVLERALRPVDCEDDD